MARKPWTPEGSSYDKYRLSAVELYADFGSVLFNSPATTKQFAPTFYREFFAALDSAKPEFKQAFFELQAWLNRPAMQNLPADNWNATRAQQREGRQFPPRADRGQMTTSSCVTWGRSISANLALKDFAFKN